MYGTDYPEPVVPDPWADPDELQDDDYAPGKSWQAIDLAETLAGLQNGTIQRLTPTVGRLVDGRGLFYPRKVNGIAGASNCGKSWTALLACVQEIQAGENVVYVDLEDDAAGILERLLALGADPPAILARFHYVRPDESYGESAQRALTELVARVHPTLVVIDSTGESLALDRAKPNDDDDVARWFRRLPSRIARMGPAVVVLDHMAKADDGALWPIGSQRKRAAITGAQYIQSTVAGFSKDTPGRSKIVCAKDRHGNYRQGQRVADLVVTPGDEHLATLWGQEEPVSAPSDARPVDLMERVSRVLEAASAPMTTNDVAEAVKGGRKAILGALDILVTEGFVSWTYGARKAHMHRSCRPYRADDDPKARQEPVDPLTGASDRFTGSGSLKEGTGEPVTDRFSEPVGNQSGTSHLVVSEPVSDTTSPLFPDPRVGSGKAAPDLDERPPCPSCQRLMGRSESAAGMCRQCQRIAERAEATR